MMDYYTRMPNIHGSDYMKLVGHKVITRYNMPKVFDNFNRVAPFKDVCRSESWVHADNRDDAYLVDDIDNLLCDQMMSISIHDGCLMTSVDNRYSRAQELGVQYDISIDGPTDSINNDAKTVYRQDSEGDTLLHVAIIVADIERALNFINIAPAPSFLSIQNNLFQSPLHLAVLTNHNAIVRRLLVGGANLESRDKDGNTCVHVACRGGNPRVIDALLDPVTDEEKTQNNFETVDQNINLVLEIPNYAGLPCLHEAARNGHVDVVRNLIERGADINSIDRKSGRTLLHVASFEGKEDVVKMLLSFPSCDINARAFDDLAPFDLARERGHHGITYELAAEGCQRESSKVLCDP